MIGGWGVFFIYMKPYSEASKQASKQASKKASKKAKKQASKKESKQASKQTGKQERKQASKHMSTQARKQAIEVTRVNPKFYWGVHPKLGSRCWGPGLGPLRAQGPTLKEVHLSEP